MWPGVALHARLSRPQLALEPLPFFSLCPQGQVPVTHGQGPSPGLLPAHAVSVPCQCVLLRPGETSPVLGHQEERGKCPQQWMWGGLREPPTRFKPKCQEPQAVGPGEHPCTNPNGGEGAAGTASRAGRSGSVAPPAISCGSPSPWQPKHSSLRLLIKFIFAPYFWGKGHCGVFPGRVLGQAVSTGLSGSVLSGPWGGP